MVVKLLIACCRDFSALGQCVPMMKFALLLFFAFSLCSCVQYQDGPVKTESGIVYDTCYVPSGHGSDIAVGITGNGQVSITPIDLNIPARWAVVFQCEHGKFVIDGARGEHCYQRLQRGDKVTIKYCDRFAVSSGKTNAVGMHFIDATKAAKPNLVRHNRKNADSTSLIALAAGAKLALRTAQKKTQRNLRPRCRVALATFQVQHLPRACRQRIRQRRRLRPLAS
jgi:hypothetical protein